MATLRQSIVNSRALFFSYNFALYERERSEGRRLVVMSAKKKNKRKDNNNNYNYNYNNDSHSFVSKSDESMGLFPEAVLLKKKTVKEDGQVLPEFADAEEEKLYETLSLQLESDLNLERMRHYEVVYLIHEKHKDEVEDVVNKVQDFIREKKGRIWRLNDWGLRRLAYQIKKAKWAHYILMNFEIDAKFIYDFKGMLDKDERVIRHLVSKEKKAVTEYCPPPMEWHTFLVRQGFGNIDDEYDYDDDEMYDDDDADGNGGRVVYVDDDDDDDDDARGDVMESVRETESVVR